MSKNSYVRHISYIPAMQIPSKSDNQSISSGRKTSLKDLLNNRHYTENLHVSEIRAEFLSLFEKLTSNAPVYILYGHESRLDQKRNPFLYSCMESVIDVRIKELSEFVQSALPGSGYITKVSYHNWYKNMPDEKCNQIIINSSINGLARISKEIPTDLSIFETMTESLNSKIYDHYKKWLDFITKNETLTDIIFNAIQPKIENILSKFDTKCDFQPYIKRIIFNKFTDYYSEDKEPSLIEPDPSFYYVKQSFITFNLILFLKLDSKPHHKLIFWHEFMNYIKKSDNPKDIKRAIEHDAFFYENSLLNLKTLWEKVIDRIRLNCEELIASVEFFDDKPSHDEEKNIIKQFGIFMLILEKLFVSVYTEEEYNYLRKKYPEELLKHIMIIDFFKDINGNLLDNNKIRKLISNWNNRIKIQLVNVFKFKSKSLVTAQ
jgi:hypothetical protein